jgi:hypothetical protein
MRHIPVEPPEHLQRLGTSQVTKPFSFQPLIIIGAARSGTNMLRDLLTQLPGVATWPCDEINYLWRYGQATFPTDELTPDLVTARSFDYIRSKFTALARQTGAAWVVEKTCANSLRVDYVRAIVPEAKFVFLVRNGLDVAASANQRWRAPLDWGYLWRKARYVPLRDLPYYAFRYFGHRLHRLASRQKRLPTWGPRFAGLDEVANSHSSLETCIRQWEASVTAAHLALVRLPAEQVRYLRYEQFVGQPAIELFSACEHLGIPCSRAQAEGLARQVHTGSIGKGRTAVPEPEHNELQKLVQATLAEIDGAWANRTGAHRQAA